MECFDKKESYYETALRLTELWYECILKSAEKGIICCTQNQIVYPFYFPVKEWEHGADLRKNMKKCKKPGEMQNIL